ncbi:MAG TPA: PEP-CTERM sorting domain-containing protein [Methylocystis sp.]|nr:PEP-CTERM sorting domain-containing protein [Methylocystis sp.]
MNRTVILAAGLVSALVFAGGSANAAVVTENLGSFSETAAQNPISFGAKLDGAKTGAFTTYIYFTVTGASPFSLTATEAGLFKGALNSLSGTFQLFSAGGTAESGAVGFSGSVSGTGLKAATSEFATLSSWGLLNPGKYYLEVNGTGGNINGATHGTVAGSVLTASVPEPSTWAMMLLGFVGVAYLGMTRKSAPAIA